MVRLYVDDLKRHGNTPARLLPEDLSVIQPGLEGYFHRWWEDQHRLWGESTPWKEPAVQAIFSVLACALGPVNRDALIRLMPPDIKLSTWTLREALHPLKRLVSGNGKQGYVFSHPRLGIFFYYEQLSEAERRIVEARFLHWGNETLEALNAGNLPPGQANPYIVQYYGPHLERTGAKERAFFALVCNGWRKAWEAFEGIYTGFLDDVGRVWKMAEQANRRALNEGQKAPYLETEVLCALCQASIVSWRTSTPISMLVNGVKGGVVEATQAVAYAQQLLDQEQRGNILAELVDYLPERRQNEVVRELLGMIPQIGKELAQSTLLIMISPHLSGPSLLEALTLASKLNHLPYRLEAELALIPYLPEPVKNETLRDAMKIGQAIHYSAMHGSVDLQSKVSLVRILAELTHYTTEPLKESLLRDALDVAQGIKEHAMPGQAQFYYTQVEALIVLVPYLSEQQLLQMITSAQTLGSVQYQRICAYGARYLPKNKRIELIRQVLQACQKIKQGGVLSEILLALVPAIDESLFTDVLKLVESMRDETYRIRTFVQLTHIMYKEFQKDIAQETLKYARRVQNSRLKAEVLVELLPYFTDQESESIVHEALAAARAVKKKVARAEMLVHIAPYVQKELQNVIIQESLKIIQSIEDESYQAYPIAAFASYAPGNQKDKLLRQAIDLARITPVDKLRLQTLLDISMHLSEPLRDEILQEILMEISVKSDGQDQMQFLISLARVISNVHQQELLGIVSSMKSERNRLLVLSELLCSLSQQLRSEITLEIMERVRSIEDERYQAQIVSKLAPCVNERILLDIVQIGRTMQDERHKTQILITSLPYLPEVMQNEVAQEALASMRSIPLHKVDESFEIHVLRVLATFPAMKGLIEEAIERANAIKYLTSKANALADLVLYVSEPENITIIYQLSNMIRNLGSESQEIVLKALNPALLQLPFTAIYPLWQKIIHGLGEHRRERLLIGLSILAPVISALGRENTIVEICEQINKVSDWWQ